MSGPTDMLDVLCISAQGGTIGLPAADVVAVRDDEELPSLDTGVPVLDLDSLVGPVAIGASPRRIRLAPASAPEVDLLTRGTLKVRTVSWGTLHAVPPWLRSLVAPLGAQALVLEADALVLLLDAADLARTCAPGEKDVGGALEPAAGSTA